MSDTSASPPARGTTTAAQLISVLPAFVVANVHETAEHYRDKLGFRLCWILGEHPGQFGIVDLDEGQGIHLKSSDPSCAPTRGRLPARASGAEAVDAYIRIPDADARHADLVRRGARVLTSPADKPWRQREFEVADSNGFTLCFGADLTGAWPKGRITTSPDFVVDDVARTASYYRERLGFTVQTFGEPPFYAIAARDAVRVHFSQADAAKSVRATSNAPAELWDAYVEMFGVRALHRELLARGAQITRGPEVVEYGNLEMDVCVDDGHVICFAVLRDDVARGMD